ncbi:MAG: hypothetical protein QNJ64_11490 [Crocosphaera sp.]|nr:hypothetical protein [Crocosphaera sp.]
MNNSNQFTEIVYVCSPNQYENMLFTSLRSLLKTNSTFDKVTIFCIGKKPTAWEILDSRIQVVEVEPLRQDDFLINKTYALTSEAERVIFLDSDTLIINPIDSVYKNVTEDFIAKPASHYFQENNSSKWKALLKKSNCQDIPYFNSGFFIFQNSSHQRLLNTWREWNHQLLSDESIPKNFHNKRSMAEQMALSLSLAESSLTYKCMEDYEHMFVWLKTQKIDSEKGVVLHTGSKAFFKHIPSLEIELGLIWDNLPRFKYYPNRIHYHRWKVTIQEAYKRTFKNKKSLFILR